LLQHVHNNATTTLYQGEGQNLVWHQINDATQKIEFYFRLGDSDIDPSKIPTQKFTCTIHFLLRRVK